VSRYYVNRRRQKTGEHEVHVDGCPWLPVRKNRIELGEFGTCQQAIEAASAKFAKVDGCWHCLPE